MADVTSPILLFSSELLLFFESQKHFLQDLEMPYMISSYLRFAYKASLNELLNRQLESQGYIEDITCLRVDTNFIFECSTRYQVEDIKLNTRIFENSPNSVRISCEHFRSFSENSRRCPKIAEGCRIFPSNRRRCFDHIEMNLGSFDN